jgi:hypothetical protein
MESPVLTPRSEDEDIAHSVIAKNVQVNKKHISVTPRSESKRA